MNRLDMPIEITSLAKCDGAIWAFEYFFLMVATKMVVELE
jgi:hypothetical protein